VAASTEYRAQKSARDIPAAAGPSVCVKKGFAVDITAYITRVIDDGDSGGSLQPVISRVD